MVMHPSQRRDKYRIAAIETVGRRLDTKAEAEHIAKQDVYMSPCRDNYIGLQVDTRIALYSTRNWMLTAYAINYWHPSIASFGLQTSLLGEQVLLHRNQ